MTALQYLQSLIAGQQAGIAVQPCELEFLRTLMLTQGQAPAMPPEIVKSYYERITTKEGSNVHPIR